MPCKWNATDHERMLLCIIDGYNLSWKVVADIWAKKFPGKDVPTQGAISQHITKLQQKSGSVSTPGKRMTATLKTPSTPMTPTANRTPMAHKKTPVSKRKADAVDSMSDADEDEPNVKALKLEKLERRESMPRRSKAAAPRFGLEEESEDGAEEEEGVKPFNFADNQVSAESDISDFDNTF